MPRAEFARRQWRFLGTTTIRELRCTCGSARLVRIARGGRAYRGKLRRAGPTYRPAPSVYTFIVTVAEMKWANGTPTDMKRGQTYKLIMTPVHAALQLSHYFRVPWDPKDSLGLLAAKMYNRPCQERQDNRHVECACSTCAVNVGMTKDMRRITRRARECRRLSLHDGVQRIAVYRWVECRVGSMLDLAYCQWPGAGR